jgi:dipeptidase
MLLVVFGTVAWGQSPCDPCEDLFAEANWRQALRSRYLTPCDPCEDLFAEAIEGCTDILVGKDASVDGSVMTSHTGACGESRVHVIPAQDFKKGAEAPVYWGYDMCDWGQSGIRPYKDYGRILGYIPQVEHTYAIFYTGYPFMNEHQLSIAESTISQRPELVAHFEISKAIMSIEMLQYFALQRCKTAREAIKLMGSLTEQYGWLPSCGTGSEALAIADPKEAWVFEVFSVGDEWDPKSGEAGAIWAAQRVPDDHIAVIPNYPVIREIDISNSDYFMASKNYMQVAIDHGWYDPDSGKPFIWQEAYANFPSEGSMDRFWLFFKTFAPSLKLWPDRDLKTPFTPYDSYPREGVCYYPFSVKPEKKLSVQDVMAFQRSTFEGTTYDMTADTDWLVPDTKGGYIKSPLTTPFPTKDMRRLLDITYHRPVAATQRGYGWVSQSRDWLPDPIGGVSWFYLDNQVITTYTPIYAGVKEINPLYNTYEKHKFSENSAKWAINFVDNLLYLNWQEGIKDLKAVREPFEAELFTKQPNIEAEALELYKKDPEQAKKFLTDYSWGRMDEVVEMYRELRNLLISKYCNDERI